jgi:RES domain-containing protein
MASRPEPRATAARPASTAAWTAWRIADGRFDPFSPVGASLVGGRWNSPGQGVIYASASYAGAMLECLAHAGIGRVPRTQVAVAIRIGPGVATETLHADGLPPGWADADLRVARSVGDAWLRERRSAVLLVPSVVARREFNVLIHPGHPHFRRIRAAAPEPVLWDKRLFGGG